jgi:hypothetical protein
MVQRMQFPKVLLNCRESKFIVHNSNVGIGEVIKVSSLCYYTKNRVKCWPHAEKIRFRNANKLFEKGARHYLPSRVGIFKKGFFKSVRLNLFR